MTGKTAGKMSLQGELTTRQSDYGPKWRHGLRARAGLPPGRLIRVKPDAARLAELATVASSGCLYLASALQKHLPSGDDCNSESHQRSLRFMSALARNGARLERLSAQLRAGAMQPAPLGKLPVGDYERLQKRQAKALSIVLTRFRAGFLWIKANGAVEASVEGGPVHARRALEGLVTLSIASAELLEDVGQSLAWFERRPETAEDLAERITQITMEGDAERQVERAARRKAAK